jgi:hypothetical protein
MLQYTAVVLVVEHFGILEQPVLEILQVQLQVKETMAALPAAVAQLKQVLVEVVPEQSEDNLLVQ